MAAPAASSASWYSVFKIAVFALLAANSANYLVSGTLSEALDTMAWLALLMLFELETGYGSRSWARNMSGVIHVARIFAAVAIGTAAIGYVNDKAWLDVANTSLWIAVIAMLEFEVRYPVAVATRRAWFAATASALYSGLAALVLIWAWHGAWFDAYDALLWLTAFAMMEMDVLGISRRTAVV